MSESTRSLSRAESSDFIICSTAAQKTEPCCAHRNVHSGQSAGLRRQIARLAKQLSAEASYLHASHWSRRRPAWKKSWFVNAPPIPSCFPALVAYISTRHLVLHVFVPHLLLHITNATNKPLTTITCSTASVEHYTHTLSHINLGCRTPIRPISRQLPTQPQSWTLHAHRTVAIPCRRCHTVTTPYPAAPRAIPTTQFLPILPFHIKSAKCRHEFSQSLLSQIRLDQVQKALAPPPTRLATPTHHRHQ